MMSRGQNELKKANFYEFLTLSHHFYDAGILIFKPKIITQTYLFLYHMIIRHDIDLVCMSIIILIFVEKQYINICFVLWLSFVTAVGPADKMHPIYSNSFTVLESKLVSKLIRNLLFKRYTWNSYRIHKLIVSAGLWDLQIPCLTS